MLHNTCTFILMQSHFAKIRERCPKEQVTAKSFTQSWGYCRMSNDYPRCSSQKSTLAHTSMGFLIVHFKVKDPLWHLCVCDISLTHISDIFQVSYNICEWSTDFWLHDTLPGTGRYPRIPRGCPASELQDIFQCLPVWATELQFALLLLCHILFSLSMKLLCVTM